MPKHLTPKLYERRFVDHYTLAVVQHKCTNCNERWFSTGDLITAQIINEKGDHVSSMGLENLKLKMKDHYGDDTLPGAPVKPLHTTKAHDHCPLCMPNFLGDPERLTAIPVKQVLADYEGNVQGYDKHAHGKGAGVLKRELETMRRTSNAPGKRAQRKGTGPKLTNLEDFL